MGDNSAISNLASTITATAYNGSYWKAINPDDISTKLVYTDTGTGDYGCIKSNWDYGITLNEDYIREIVEKLTKQKEAAKITPDEGPEIPKWTGFLDI